MPSSSLHAADKETKSQKDNEQNTFINLKPFQEVMNLILGKKTEEQGLVYTCSRTWLLQAWK